MNSNLSAFGVEHIRKDSTSEAYGAGTLGAGAGGLGYASRKLKQASKAKKAKASKHIGLAAGHGAAIGYGERALRQSPQAASGFRMLQMEHLGRAASEGWKGAEAAHDALSYRQGGRAALLGAGALGAGAVGLGAKSMASASRERKYGYAKSANTSAFGVVHPPEVISKVKVPIPHADAGVGGAAAAASEKLKKPVTAAASAPGKHAATTPPKMSRFRGFVPGFQQALSGAAGPGAPGLSARRGGEFLGGQLRKNPVRTAGVATATGGAAGAGAVYGSNRHRRY